MQGSCLVAAGEGEEGQLQGSCHGSCRWEQLQGRGAFL